MSIACLVVSCTLITTATADQPRHVSHLGQHGGVMLPAANDTLHVEGVFQEQRRFRVYVTEVTGEPVTAGRLGQIQARVVDGVNPERTIAPLVPSADGAYLEARIGTVTLPAVITFVVRATPEAGEETLGLMFSSYSVEPPTYEVPPTVIPGTLPEVLTALRSQVIDARQMIASGSFGTLYIPATHMRELLLGLLPYSERLQPSQRLQTSAAIAEALRVSWLVHAAGDLGSPPQNRAGSELLRGAFNDLVSAFDLLVVRLSQ